MVAKKRAVLISIVLLCGILVGFLVTPRASVTGAFIGAGWDLTDSGEDGYNQYWIYTNGERVLKIQLNIFETVNDAAEKYEAELRAEDMERPTIFSLVRYEYEPGSPATAGEYNSFHAARYDEKDKGYFLVLGTYKGNSYLDIAYANQNRKYYKGVYTEDVLWLKKLAISFFYE